MKFPLFLGGGALVAAAVAAPLTAPCLRGACPEDAQTEKTHLKESPMFGLFNSTNDQNPKQMIKDGALVIDVRTQDEWSEGHLPMAKLLPVDQLPARLADVAQWTGGDKSKPIVVHCRSGARSGRAQAILKNAGYTHVVNGGGYGSLR